METFPKFHLDAYIRHDAPSGLPFLNYKKKNNVSFLIYKKEFLGYSRICKINFSKLSKLTRYAINDDIFSRRKGV